MGASIITHGYVKATMSRVDFVVDGETVEQVHQHAPDGVRISFNGGKSWLSPESYEHIVVEVDTEPPDDD